SRTNGEVRLQAMLQATLEKHFSVEKCLKKPKKNPLILTENLLDNAILIYCPKAPNSKKLCSTVRRYAGHALGVSARRFLGGTFDLDRKKGFHEVECLSVSGGIGDEIALVEEGIQFRVEKCTGGKMGRFRGHKVRPCKMILKTL
ncbi:MAG: hypothetical protein FWE95_06385, partial [Planctomycetaceae bacterium]|nr:hypothetical protein [Planctomycetaceae bacterium]